MLSLLKPHHRIYLVGFLVDCALMVGFHALPFFVARELGGAEGMIGVIAGVQSAFYALICLGSAPFVHRAKHGLRLGVAGLIFYGIIFAVSCLTKSAMLFGLLSIVSMAGLSFIWPAMQSWLGHEQDLKVRSRRLTCFNISWSAGLAVGPLLGGYLYELHYGYAFAAVFLLSMLAAWVLYTIPHEEHVAGEVDEEAMEETQAHGLTSETFLYCAWAANLVSWALVGVTRSVFMKRVEDLVAVDLLVLPLQWDLPSHDYAAVYGAWVAFAVNAARAGMFILMGRSGWWHHKYRWLFLSQVAAAGAFYMLGQTHSLLIMVACGAVVGINNGVAMFSALLYGLADPKIKHRRSAVNEAMVGIGSCAGSMSFGYLAGTYGASHPYTLTPLFILAAVVLQVGLLRYGRKRFAQACPAARNGTP
jgi:MFS family permease